LLVGVYKALRLTSIEQSNLRRELQFNTASWRKSINWCEC